MTPIFLGVDLSGPLAIDVMERTEIHSTTVLSASAPLSHSGSGGPTHR